MTTIIDPDKALAAVPADQGAGEPALSDAALLAAFNSGDSVLDGLHEVASLIIRELWPKGEYEPTVTLLRALVDEQWAEIVKLRTAPSLQVTRNSVLEEVAQAIKDRGCDQWSIYYHLVQGLKTTAQQVEPADPMETPLPCDVTVGPGTIKKGVPLRTLVKRMEVLHKMATDAFMQRWISVSDRLPECDIECTTSETLVSKTLLVAGPGKSIGFGHLQADGKWIVYDGEFEQMMPTPVTHWMPLPGDPS